MKTIKALEKAFGVDEYGFVDYPVKISNVKVSRFINAGCPFCFPHGFEEGNSTIGKNTRSWKCNRKKQYKYNGRN